MWQEINLFLKRIQSLDNLLSIIEMHVHIWEMVVSKEYCIPKKFLKDKIIENKDLLGNWIRELMNTKPTATFAIESFKKWATTPSPQAYNIYFYVFSHIFST